MAESMRGIPRGIPLKPRERFHDPQQRGLKGRRAPPYTGAPRACGENGVDPVATPATNNKGRRDPGGKEQSSERAAPTRKMPAARTGLG